MREPDETDFLFCSKSPKTASNKDNSYNKYNMSVVNGNTVTDADDDVMVAVMMLMMPA